MFLIPAELKQLTGKKTKAAQRRALVKMGYTFDIRPDGMPLVLKSHIEKRLDGTIANAITESVQPNWKAMR